MDGERCPVCDGDGYVPARFYGDDDDEQRTCRTCGGRKVVPRKAAVGAPQTDPTDLTDYGPAR